MDDDDQFESWPRKSARIRDREATKAAEAAKALQEKENESKHQQRAKRRNPPSAQVQTLNRAKAVQAKAVQANATQAAHGKSTTSPSRSAMLKTTQAKITQAKPIQADPGKSAISSTRAATFKAIRAKVEQAKTEQAATPHEKSTPSSWRATVSSVSLSSTQSGPFQPCLDPENIDVDVETDAEAAYVTAVGTPNSSLSSPLSCGTVMGNGDEDLGVDESDCDMNADSENDGEAEEEDDDEEMPSCLEMRIRPSVSGKTLPGARTRSHPRSHSLGSYAEEDGDEEGRDDDGVERGTGEDEDEDEGGSGDDGDEDDELLSDTASESSELEYSDEELDYPDDEDYVYVPLTGREYAGRMMRKFFERFMESKEYLLTPLSFVIYWMPTTVDDNTPEDTFDLYTLPLKAMDREWDKAEVVDTLRSDQVAHWLQISIGNLLGFLVQATPSEMSRLNYYLHFRLDLMRTMQAMPSCFGWLNTDDDPQPGDPVYEVLHRFRSLDDEQQRLLLWCIKKETRIRREADARNKIDTMPYRPIVHDDFDTRAQLDYLLKTWDMHRARTSPVIEFRASKRFFPDFVDLRARNRWFVKVEVTEESLEALTPKEVLDTIKADHEFLHQLDSSRADYQESKMVEDEVVMAAQDPRFPLALMVNPPAQAPAQVPGVRASPPQPRGPPPLCILLPPRGPPPPPCQHMQQQVTGGRPTFHTSASTISMMAPMPLPHIPFQNIDGNSAAQASASTSSMAAPLPLPSHMQAQITSVDLALRASASTTPMMAPRPLPSHMQAQTTSVESVLQISASTTPMPLPIAYIPLQTTSGEATLQGSVSTTPLLATQALPPQYMQLHTTGYGPGFQGSILAGPMGPPPVLPRPQQYQQPLHPQQYFQRQQSLHPLQPLYPQQPLHPLQRPPPPLQFRQPIPSLTMNASTSALLHRRALKVISTDDNWWRHELLQIMEFHRKNSPTTPLQFDLPFMNQHIVDLQRDVQRERQRSFVRILCQKALVDQQRRREQEAAARQQQEILLQLEVERLLREQQRQQQEAMAVQLQQALQPLFDQQQQEAIGFEIQRMVEIQGADQRQQQHQQSLQYLADRIQQQTAAEEVQQVQQQQQQLEQGEEHRQQVREQESQSAEQQQQQQKLEPLQQQAGQRPQQQSEEQHHSSTEQHQHQQSAEIEQLQQQQLAETQQLLAEQQHLVQQLQLQQQAEQSQLQQESDTEIQQQELAAQLQLMMQQWTQQHQQHQVLLENLQTQQVVADSHQQRLLERVQQPSPALSTPPSPEAD
ncbi:hypothetical protein KI688_001895 [Linnemannia hyalina]|uniref:Uncharacterized protein n=1 Tax=Linnemannia hyalina TaxID=64524 RepID=A0A9P8BS35_9FUNG|nr:hypothetical protein KI688_001895 [Linnemannia hyalina]